MMGIYRRAVRPLLFRLDPEWVHTAAISLGHTVGRLGAAAAVRTLYGFSDPRLRQRCGALDFANPVGLAAGFDKNGKAVRTLAAVGFGSVEVGAVSAHSSSGNAMSPRLLSHRVLTLI